MADAPPRTRRSNQFDNNFPSFSPSTRISPSSSALPSRQPVRVIFKGVVSSQSLAPSTVFRGIVPILYFLSYLYLSGFSLSSDNGDNNHRLDKRKRGCFSYWNDLRRAIRVNQSVFPVAIRRLLGSILARKAPGETFFARAVKIRHEIELYTDELVFPIRGNALLFRDFVESEGSLIDLRKERADRGITLVRCVTRKFERR